MNFNEWGFWEVALAALALVFAVWTVLVYERRRNKKELVYIKSESIPLIVDQPGAEKLTVMLGDQPVRRPHTLSVEIRNNARVPVMPDDFIESIQFFPMDDVPIIYASVVARDPVNLKPTVVYSQTEVTIQPLLLNGGDSFKVSILSDGAVTKPLIAARVAGVRDIREIVEPNNQWSFRVYLIFLAGLLTAVLVDIVSNVILSKLGR